MKKFITLITLIMVLLFSTVCFADIFRWSHSETATGYILYYTDATDNNSEWSKNVGYVNSYNLPLMPGHEYINIYCKAYNDYGASDSSNIINHTANAYIPIDNPQIIESEPQIIPPTGLLSE